MICRSFATLTILAILLTPASAQERVTVGTQRLGSSGVLFLAAAQGYFKAEGLDVEMTAYPTPQVVVEALAGGSTDFGVAEFTGAAFNLAGKGAIKAIAASAREKSGYEGNQIVASNAAHARGLRKAEDIAGKSFAVGLLGGALHSQLGQIARIKKFDVAGVTLKPMPSLDAIARAIASGDADAAILPPQQARELLTASQGKLVAWVSEIDEPQLGAVFASAKTIETRRATVEKFLRAYRRGAAEYNAALMRKDRYAKRITDATSQAAAKLIAQYVYPGQTSAVPALEAALYFVDAPARLDIADIETQIAWLKSQNLIDSRVNARAVVDGSFTK